MKCQVYPFKHQGQTCVMFPTTTKFDFLPKSVRHEVDTGSPWPVLDLRPGEHLGSMDEDLALRDIRSEGYHIQHLNPGDEMILRKAG
ncbi:hypothetical protein ACFLQY_03075 [Verrucomicrobiota bacterium]